MVIFVHILTLQTQVSIIYVSKRNRPSDTKFQIDSGLVIKDPRKKKIVNPFTPFTPLTPRDHF
jgi:hypothetical protein